MQPHQVFLSYWLSRSLITAVQLGVFDRLERGPQTAEEVAQGLRLDPGATARLLRAMEALGFVQRHGQTFANTPVASAQLVTSSPQYIGSIAYHHAEQLWPLWEHLPIAVREGRPVLREAFGGDRNPFDLLTATPEVLLKLLGGMHAGAKGLGEWFVPAHDFTRHRHVMDVGGGTGVVTAPVAERYPHLRVTVFDLPQVCSVLGPILDGYGCGERIQAHPGDFFNPRSFPAGCDAAMLCRVLHNWDDGKAAAILRNTYEALLPGSIVLVAEHMLDTADPWSRIFGALSDLTMLVMTDGGRERTAAEYEGLLRRAGFSMPHTVRIHGGLALVRGQKR